MQRLNEQQELPGIEAFITMSYALARSMVEVVILTKEGERITSAIAKDCAEKIARALIGTKVVP